VEFHPNRKTSVRSMDGDIFSYISKAWLSLRTFLQNSQSIIQGL